MKRFVLLGVFFCAAVLAFTALARQCGQPLSAPAPEAPEEPLTLEWSRGTIVMNAGETRDIEWISNKTIQPLVYCEGSAAAVTALHGNSVRIRAIAGGVDSLTVELGALRSVCVITVNDDAFSFILSGEDGHNAGIEVGVGEIRSVDILAEPVSLLRQTGIHYLIQDETIAGIVDFDTYYVTIQGRKEGHTTLLAEWRGKQIETALTVTDNEPRTITVPYTKRYLNIGQETKITVWLENGNPEDETRFRFTSEPAKNSINVEGMHNTAVVKALREGVQYIRVSHPLARDSRIITFDVLPPAPPPPPSIELSESPLLVAKGETKPLTMTVMNGKAADNQKFSFQVAENCYAVEAKQKGNILNITGIAPGAALIRISNSAVSRDYELMVVVDSYGFN
ncbi:MAG: hypothetical protein LBU85_11410 [Treponema sp.]|jgi:hypothetical protein|nr:hypothetical protein [Treponema sp.]